MKVTIVVGGRFHAFDLAQQLEKKGYLLNIITSYPFWKINKKFYLKKKKNYINFFKRISRKINT